MEIDAGIIRQILLGNRDLFEQIIIKYQNLVYTVCLNIVENPHDAENMAQETFLTAYSSLAGFRGENLKAWLCRIAANKSIDCKRKRSRFAMDEFIDSVELAGESAEDTLIRTERIERLEHILAVLPEKYIHVVRAFYYNRLTVKEISRWLELPERTVETRLYRAKRLIRERWGDDEN
jgi:RNA polymerase sigma-70 factor (ECF subfamily)